MEDSKDSLLACSGCSRYFSKTGVGRPVLLFCGHSCCQSCISPSTTNSQLPCHACQKITILGPDGISSLIENEKLLDALPTLKRLVINCELCYERPSIMFCSDCGHEYCQECSDTAHKPEGMKSHQQIEGHRPSLQTPQKCAKHGETLETYCVKCKVLICSSCKDLNHSSHSTEMAEEIAKTKRQVLENSTHRLAGFLKELSVTTNRVSECVRDLKNLQKEAELSVNNIFDDVNQNLTQRKLFLINMVQQESVEKQRSLVSEGNVILEVISELQIISAQLDALLSNDDVTLVKNQTIMKQISGVCKKVASCNANLKTDTSLPVNISPASFRFDQLERYGGSIGVPNAPFLENVHVKCAEGSAVKIECTLNRTLDISQCDKASFQIREESKSVSEEKWIDASLSEVEFPHFFQYTLTAGRNYLLRAQLRNSLGWSGYSKEYSFTCPIRKLVYLPIEFPAQNVINSSNVMFTENCCVGGERRPKRESKRGIGHLSYGTFLPAGGYVLQAWYTSEEPRPVSCYMNDVKTEETGLEDATGSWDFRDNKAVWGRIAKFHVETESYLHIKIETRTENWPHLTRFRIKKG